MTKAIKTERRSEREGNATVENGSQVGNSSIVENSSKANNTVSLTANRKYNGTVFRMLFLIRRDCLNSTMPCRAGIM